MEKVLYLFKVLLLTRLASNNMKANGRRTKWVDKEIIIILMDQCIKDSGEPTNHLEEELMNLQTEPYIKDNGKIINYMEQAFS